MNPESVSVTFKCGHVVEMFSPGRADPKGLWRTQDNPTSDKLCGPCLKNQPKN